MMKVASGIRLACKRSECVVKETGNIFNELKFTRCISNFTHPAQRLITPQAASLQVTQDTTIEKYEVALQRNSSPLHAQTNSSYLLASNIPTQHPLLS